jgi:hypothetical protein
MQIGGTGCDRGSWDAFQPQPDEWGRAAGRLFVTSLSLLTLEVYYRYLPLYQPSDADAPHPDSPPADGKIEKEKAAAQANADGLEPQPANR